MKLSGNELRKVFMRKIHSNTEVEYSTLINSSATHKGSKKKSNDVKWKFTFRNRKQHTAKIIIKPANFSTSISLSRHYHTFKCKSPTKVECKFSAIHNSFFFAVPTRERMNIRSNAWVYQYSLHNNMKRKCIHASLYDSLWYIVSRVYEKKQAAVVSALQCDSIDEIRKTGEIRMRK